MRRIGVMCVAVALVGCAADGGGDVEPPGWARTQSDDPPLVASGPRFEYRHVHRATTDRVGGAIARRHARAVAWLESGDVSMQSEAVAALVRLRGDPEITTYSRRSEIAVDIVWGVLEIQRRREPTASEEQALRSVVDPYAARRSGGTVSPEAVVMVADRVFAEGRYARASQMYGWVVTDEPDEPDELALYASYRLGWSRYLQGRRFATESFEAFLTVVRGAAVVGTARARMLGNAAARDAVLPYAQAPGQADAARLFAAMADRSDVPAQELEQAFVVLRGR